MVKMISPINRLTVAIAVVGRLNNGSNGANVFNNTPRMIVMK